MLLLVQKILYALKYNNFFFRASILFFSHCQKIIFLPFIYIANKKNFAKLDYLSGFKEKNSLNLINKPFLKKTIKFYHDNLKKNKAIHGIWEENLQLKFYEFRKALLNKNILKLNYIFNNMFRLPITEGLCVGYEHFRNSKNLFGKIYIKTLFNNYLLELNKKININMLRFENIGNPSGVKFKKNILSIETLRHANQALTMTELTSNIKRPKILEIGGGLGGNCYQYMYSFNKNKKIDYYLVDILEVLLMAGFFLQKSRGLVFLNSLPKKKIN